MGTVAESFFASLHASPSTAIMAARGSGSHPAYAVPGPRPRILHVEHVAEPF